MYSSQWLLNDQVVNNFLKYNFGEFDVIQINQFAYRL